MFVARVASKRSGSTLVRVAQRNFGSASVVTEQSGQIVGGFHLRNEEDYRVYFKDPQTGERISPWHDIPLLKIPDDKEMYAYVFCTFFLSSHYRFDYF